MPLSAPVAREAHHIRQIECRGYRRADGLWDIEGHLVDTKAVEVDHPWEGRLPVGEPMHDMWIRLTVDESLMVHDVEAVTDRAPYPVCPQAARSLAAVKGHRIQPGWSNLVKRLLGGAKSCTHLMELLMPVATTAYQTMASQRRVRDIGPRAGEVRPAKIDSCWAYSRDRMVVARFWPEFYEGP